MAAIEQIVKLLGQTSGRDKIYRSFQYGGKFLWWSLERQGNQDAIVKKLKILETHLSTSRKLLRIANSVSFLQAAFKSMQSDDHVLRLVITLSKLNSAFYMLFDHIIWAHRIGLVQVDQNYYSKLSNRFWLATLILNLTRDMYEFLLLANDLPQIAKETGDYNLRSDRYSPNTLQPVQSFSANVSTNGGPRRRVSWHSDVEDRLTNHVPAKNLVAIVWRNRKEVVLDTIKNACDLVLPASSLGYLETNPGQQGFFGLISSLIGLLTVWDNRYKL